MIAFHTARIMEFEGCGIRYKRDWFKFFRVCSLYEMMTIIASVIAALFILPFWRFVKEVT